MHQPALLRVFDEAITLSRDSSGLIVHHRCIFDEETSARYFASLLEGTAWRAERRPMYDRIVDVPRLIAWFGAEAGFPEPLARIVSTVSSLLGVSFDSAGLNLYRDGRDSVAWHSDREVAGRAESTIAIASFGDARRLMLRRKDPAARKTLVCDLLPGSVLVMAGAAQHHWEHHVPKEPRAVGPRIGVVLRQGIAT
jgi:alkylated DNA repair dioxygenase AlkB